MRKARSEDEGFRFYHLLVEGIDTLNIFSEHKFKTYYIGELERRVSPSVKLIAYIVLENHAHLLFYAVNTTKLSAVMRSVNTAFAIYFNKTRERSGYVFNGRYRSQGIPSLTGVADCIEYVHDNCVSEDSLFTPRNYPYSSYKKLAAAEGDVGHMLDNLGVPYEEIMWEGEKQKWFDLPPAPVKHEKYTAVLHELCERYRIKGASDTLVDKRFVKQFAEELRSRTGASFRTIADEIGINRETLRKLVND